MNRFLAGYIVAVSMNSLYQDSLGVDKYCTICRLFWQDAHYTVTYAIIGIIIAIALYLIGD